MTYCDEPALEKSMVAILKFLAENKWNRVTVPPYSKEDYRYFQITPAWPDDDDTYSTHDIHKTRPRGATKQAAQELVRRGFLKNRCSHRYKEYGISPAGLRFLSRDRHSI